MGADVPGLPADLSLGAAIKFLRRRAGMAQHELTRRLGLSARSNLSDYERGRRVPPPDIILACEEIFGLREGELQRLRSRTLGDRARESARGSAPAGGGAVLEDGTGQTPGPEPARGASPASPEADGGSGPPQPSPGGGRRLRRGVVAALVTAVLAALVTAASVMTAFAGHPSAGGRHPATPTPQPAQGTLHDLTHHDGDDPAITGCSQDVVTLAEASVRLPGGAVFGRLLLRHSRNCEMSWGAVWGPNPHLYRVYIIASRPRDHATAPSSWAGNTPPGSYGNMLSTVPGCVRVSAYVRTPGGTGPVASTMCAK